MSDVIRHIVIRGKVQGVGYRAWVEAEAAARKLDGWVRNRKDGSVEAVLAGAADAVEAMVAKCRLGPGMARVEAIEEDSVDPFALDARRPDERFSVLPTI